MTARYSPPPNWPQPPPGWSPPAGWKPDPAWGPAPAGHQFWVEDQPPRQEVHPAYASPSPGPADQQPRGRGLVITAFVLAVASLLLCWIPIVNNVVFFLGVIALILSVVALVISRKGSGAGRGMSVAAILISVLSLVGVLATQAFYGSILDDMGTAIEEGADGNTSRSDSEEDAAADALTMGESTEIGTDYIASVDKVLLNANAAIERANTFNEPPAGQYVLVTLTVEYTGDDEGDPWIDLETQFLASNAKNYHSSSCDAVEPRPDTDLPTLAAGGSATYQVCFDVPRRAVDNARVSVGDAFSISETREFWKTR